MKTMRDIISKNDQLEQQLNELKEIVTDVAYERSSTGFYDLLRFMPITNMFVNVFGMFKKIDLRLISFFLISLEISRREKLEKRINKVLKN
jgi:hypothetical protein